MKKEKRFEYLLLNDLENDIPDPLGCGICLCNWCKFVQWEGCSCDESWPECHHPLIEAFKGFHTEDVWDGADCWGFRPMYKQSDCVDVVGLWLQGKHVDFDTIPEISGKKLAVK
ncbi:MAG: hypothetical protein PHO67_07830 [Candidatus Omnitrophica bacterium]|nr:hypothetical protein [Candidatus Omnitrophota bacterium]